MQNMEGEIEFYSYHCDDPENVKIQGTGTFNSVKFEISVHKRYMGEAPNKPPAYTMVCSAISPKTGLILQTAELIKKKLDRACTKLEQDEKNQQDQRSKILKYQEQIEMLSRGERVEGANATTSRIIHDLSIKNLEQQGLETIKSLYAKYRDVLQNELQIDTKYRLPTTFELYKLYEKRFLSSRELTEKLREQKEKYLLEMCQKFSMVPVEKMDDKYIKTEYQKLAKSTARRKLGILRDFLDYCGGRNAYNGDNPVGVFIDHTRFGKRGKTSKIIYKQKSDHLSDDVEDRLHDLMIKDLDIPCGLAIPLIKGMGFSLDEVLSVQYKDFVHENGILLIEDYQDDLSGGTRNFIRPPLKETADMIELWLEKHPDKIGSSHHVVHIPGKDLAEKKVALTKFIRQRLDAAGKGDPDYEALRSESRTKQTGGAGVKMLQKHRLYVLHERCGVEDNTSVDSYLKGNQMPNMTGDRYCGYDNERGAKYLNTVTRRDDRYGKENQTGDPDISYETSENGDQSVLVHQCGPSLKTCARSKQPIFIPKGTTIAISGELGITLQLQVIDATEDIDRLQHFKASDYKII